MKKGLRKAICSFTFLAGFLGLAGNLSAQVKLDAHSNANGASTWNITTTHANELIIISAGGYAWSTALSKAAGTVKVNGINATYITEGSWINASFSWQEQIWAYVAPAAGVYACTCTETGLSSPFYFNFAASCYETGCTLNVGDIIVGGHDSNQTLTSIIATITTPVNNCWVYGSVDNNDNGGTGVVAWNGQLTMLDKTYITNGVDGAQADSTYALAGTYNIKSTDLGASNVWMTLTLIAVKPNCVLPVELLNFTCDNNYGGKGIELMWSTATETNSGHFTLERSSDGIQFAPIATVPAAGNSTTQHNYTWVDENPLPGNNYYRLVETDLDGNNQTFNVSSCAANNATNEVYPNPSNGTFTLSIGASASTQSIIIYDLTGREVMRQQFEPNADNATYTISLPPGNKGIFMARILNGEQEVAVKKLLVY